MGYGLDHPLAEPFPEFHHPLLVARWTEMSTLAREGQQILMTAVPASDSGKSIMQDAAIEIAVNHLLNIMAKKAVLLLRRELLARPERRLAIDPPHTIGKKDVIASSRRRSDEAFIETQKEGLWGC
jgi:hypothetical protein